MNGCHAAFPSPSLSIPLLSLDLCWDGEDEERRMRRREEKRREEDEEQGPIEGNNTIVSADLATNNMNSKLETFWIL
jgi:hypothetical protein